MLAHFEDSLVGLLQLMDLSLQLEVVRTTCRHPAERDREESREKEREREGGIDKIRKEGYQITLCYDVALSPFRVSLCKYPSTECYLAPHSVIQ